MYNIYVYVCTNNNWQLLSIIKKKIYYRPQFTTPIFTYLTNVIILFIKYQFIINYYTCIKTKTLYYEMCFTFLAALLYNNTNLYLYNIYSTE